MTIRVSVLCRKSDLNKTDLSLLLNEKNKVILYKFVHIKISNYSARSLHSKCTTSTETEIYLIDLLYDCNTIKLLWEYSIEEDSKLYFGLTTHQSLYAYDPDININYLYTAQLTIGQTIRSFVKKHFNT